MTNHEFIAGIDYSLCGPAICVHDTTKPFSFYSCQFYFLTSIKKYARQVKSNIFGEKFSSYDQETQRYESIADWALNKVVGCSQVALEGYAYGATGRVFHIAENTGVLKYKLYQQSLPVEIIPPAVVKKYATTKGNASKSLMYQSFFEESGVPLKDFLDMEGTEIRSPLSDIVDSYYICKHLNASLVDI